MPFLAKIGAFLSKYLLVPVGLEILNRLVSEFKEYLATKKKQAADHKANAEAVKKLDDAQTPKEVEDATKDLVNRL